MMHDWPSGAKHGLERGPKKAKAPDLYGLGLSKKKLRRCPTLPQELSCSTIGPGGLNFRVRDGIGCGPSGNTTGNLLTRSSSREIKKRRLSSCVSTLTFTLQDVCLLRIYNFFSKKKNDGQASRPISTG